MLTYAEPDDLMDGWMAEPPETAKAVTAIRYASILVRRYTACDLYEVDPAGAPTEPDIIEAFRDATCAQAAMWLQAGIDASAGSAGQAIAVKSQTADGGSVTYGDAPSAQDIERSLTKLSQTAVMILRNAGLASSRPSTW